MDSSVHFLTIFSHVIREFSHQARIRLLIVKKNE